jgi:nucleotide-binding universal stress UspA family protein
MECPIPKIEKIEKLLLATDSSKYCDDATREAITLAKACGSKLFVITVIKTNPELIAQAPGLLEKMEKETKKRLEAVQSQAKNEGVDCEILIREGEEPHEYIVDEAAKHKTGMIVVGRHGRTGLLRAMMGSVAGKVIGYTLCRVLVVPKDSKLSFEKLLIATDGSMHSEFATQEAISIAQRSGSTLMALSVAKKDENLALAKECVEMVKKEGDKASVKVDPVVRTGVPHDVIVKTATQENIGLIVIGSHGRTGISKLLMGSTTERVIGNAKNPVLVWKL